VKVLVGLGNPGREYAKTRHNVGWMLLDELVPRLAAGKFRAERSVEVAEAFHNGEKVYLVKPQTYMNRSGQALAMWLGQFKEIRDAVRAEGVSSRSASANSRAERSEPCLWPGLFVLSDDVHLPLGRIRIRSGGSAGGHNGLKDIEKALGGQGYPRLRMGVDSPPDRMDRADYVLARFAASEMPVIEAMLANALRAVDIWLRDGLEAAMDKANGSMPETEYYNETNS